ncbi:hypothetical protein N7486_000744 [Penicillium sp. IBT 16267x]|nr:hypothetical protein N7486_000744 [Penicillium sp. IBT 16267x]
MDGHNHIHPQLLLFSPEQHGHVRAAISTSNDCQQAQIAPPGLRSEKERNPDHVSSSRLNGLFSGAFDDALSYVDPFLFGDDNVHMKDSNSDMFFKIPGLGDYQPDVPGNTSILETSGPSKKRKPMDERWNTDDEQTGKRRMKSKAKQPCRNLLTLEQERKSKRKAQNSAAQKAFRERRERYLIDVEAKLDELQTSFALVTQDNALLRAQAEQLKLEILEYGKRIAWIANWPGVSMINAISDARSNERNTLHNDKFLYDSSKSCNLFGMPSFSEEPPRSDGVFQSKDSDILSLGVLAAATSRTRRVHRPLSRSTVDSHAQVCSARLQKKGLSAGTAYTNLESHALTAPGTCILYSASDSCWNLFLLSNEISPEKHWNYVLA